MDSLLKCPLCLANSGRFTQSAHCCQVRKLADAPKHARTARFDALRQEQGKTTANQMINEVNAELAARREAMAKKIEDVKASIRTTTGRG